MINLTKGFIVDVDDLNYTLKKETGVNKKGETTYKVCGYFGKLKGAVAHCISLIQRDKLRDGTFELEQALDVINQSEKEFEKLLSKAIREAEDIVE